MTDSPHDCAAALAELDAFLRGELPVDAAERMRGHLDQCHHCAEIQRYEEAFRQRLLDLQKKTICPEALRAKIDQLLAQGDADS